MGGDGTYLHLQLVVPPRQGRVPKLLSLPSGGRASCPRLPPPPHTSHPDSYCVQGFPCTTSNPHKSPCRGSSHQPHCTDEETEAQSSWGVNTSTATPKPCAPASVGGGAEKQGRPRMARHTCCGPCFKKERKKCALSALSLLPPLAHRPSQGKEGPVGAKSWHRNVLGTETVTSRKGVGIRHFPLGVPE